MSKKFIDDLIKLDNKIMEAFDNKHKVLGYLRKKFYKNMRVGFQLLDDDGKVTDKYTIIVKDKPFIDSYETGLKNIKFVKSVKKSLIEKMMKDHEKKWLESPLRQGMKYVPLSMKWLVKGDVKINYHKKK